MSAPIIRPQELRDDATLLEIYRRAFPRFPQESLDDYRRRVESWRKRGRRFWRFVVEIDEAVVGRCLFSEIESQEPGIFGADVLIDPEHRGHGAGTALAFGLFDLARTEGAGRVLTEVLDDDPRSRAFAEAWGFEPTGRGEQLSRLHVPSANLEGFDTAEAQVRESGIRIERLADLDTSEAFMRTLHALDETTHRDVLASIDWTFPGFDKWMDDIVLGPGRSPEWSWIAMDGVTPVGIGRLRLFGRETALNAYTGVDRAHRGRGIARALKFRTILFCREQRILYIFTGNDVENHRMLAINRSLGYEPLPRTVEMVRAVTE